jgi:hypothetical protein
LLAAFFIEENEMLTASKLRRLLSYNKTTGLFRWRVRTSNRIRVGSVAGCERRDGFRKIAIEGKSYLANRLAVLHTTGRMPANNVTRRNGNRSDDRWRNLRVA